jgi:CrcB protein
VTAVWVFTGGGLGALARYGLSRWIGVPDLSAGAFPWATLSANLLACAVLGIGIAYLADGRLSRSAQLVLLTGFCGGFSTFSTYAQEGLDLARYGHTSTAVLYIGLSLISGMAVLWLAAQIVLLRS